MNELQMELSDLSKEINEKVAIMQKEVKALAEKALNESVQKLFDAHPIVNEIFWTQYTPYFNDGEACEFSVNEAYFILEGDEDADDYEGTHIPGQWDIEYYTNKYASAKYYEENGEAAWVYKYVSNPGRWSPKKPDMTSEEAMKKINRLKEQRKTWEEKGLSAFENDFEEFAKVVYNIPEEIMKNTFGDHVKVRIYRDDDGLVKTEVDEYDHD